MKKKIVLFITRNIEKNFGGGIVTSRNIKCLKNINSIELYTVFLNKSINKIESHDYYIISAKSKIEIFLNSLLLYNGQLNFSSERKIINIVKKIKPDVIFYDGSYYGRLIRKINHINQNIKHITYFHNVELNYNRDLIKLKGFLYLPLYFASKYNEKLASRYSDVLIAINKRDSLEIKRIYNRNVNYIIPVTLEDKFDINKAKSSLNKKNDFLKIIFIGSNFFPNYHGIKWFIEKIMPYVNKSILFVVGKGFENCKELERENVVIVGKCENVEKYYYDSDVFVSPIFYGSGMKVKTVEALMYGKTIIATREAFEGYDMINLEKVGFLCESEEEFIKSINFLNVNKINEIRLNKYSREVFSKYYSDDVALKMFKKVFLEFKE